MKRWILLAAAALSAPAFAVSTSNWTQTNQADFKTGTLENVVATNLGDMKLSRAVKTLLEQDPQISSVNSLAEAPDGTVYAGTGPHGVLLKIHDDKVTPIATIEDATEIDALVVDKKGRLLVGVSGAKGRVYRIDKPGDKPHVIFEAADVQYVWALHEMSDGTVCAATGPNGQLFEITPDGNHKVLFDCDENNLLSLATDGKDLLYVGTDPHGLVYRVNRKTGESFVLYNAAESEISALALDSHGNLYAATAEARDDMPGAATAPSAEKNGRPEGGATGVPLPSENPKNPKPPELPDPNPGRPDPIPKQAAPDKVLHHRSRSANGSHARVQFAAMTTLAAEPSGPDAPKPKPPHPTPPNPGPGPGKPKPPTPGPTPGSPDLSALEGAGPGKQPTVNTAGTGGPRPEGNAVYKIDPQGFVTEVFRQPVLVLSMVEHEGTLLIATGSEGEIYQVNPAAGETVVLAKADPKQILCLLPTKDGRVMMGMANVGSIAAMSSGFADKGTYISPVLDATQISRFGKMQLHGSLPAGTALKVSTRSGNVKDAAEKSWSKWTDDAPAAEFLPISSPSARFLQYRLTFTSKEGKSTPVVEDVNVAYQMPNLPPQVKTVKITSAGENASNPLANPALPGAGENELRRVESARRQTITWEASDPNGDALQYSLFFRQGTASPWILLKDKLTETQFEWDTRSVADGRYEIKLVASDANANPPGQGRTASRVSDPILVDNTPPVIGDLRWKQQGQNVQIDLNVADRTSTVAAFDYSVDSNRDWQAVLPVDNIFDSPEEKVSISVPALSPGQHQITLRATDARGNQAFENLVVTVEGPAARR